MSETYELSRRIIRRGTLKTMSTVRFRKSGGMPIYSGDTRIGYLTPDVPFEMVDNRLGITFGPNRSFAPSAHYLKSGDGNLIAEIRHGFVQSVWGAKQFTARDASGAPLFKLVPGKTLKIGADQLSGARLRGELYAVRGGDILGHTGCETEAGDSDSAVAKAAGRLGRIVTQAPGAFADNFKE